jgi:hypothetical protein
MDTDRDLIQKEGGSDIQARTIQTEESCHHQDEVHSHGCLCFCFVNSKLRQKLDWLDEGFVIANFF